MTAQHWTLQVPPTWTKRDRQVAAAAANESFRSGFAEGAKAAANKGFEEGAAGMMRWLHDRGRLSPGPDESELVREVVRDREGRISEVIERKVPRRAG